MIDSISFIAQEMLLVFPEDASVRTMAARSPISTEGRIFARQVIREVIQCERVGSDVLWPGAESWPQALSGLVGAIHSDISPIKRAALIKAAAWQVVAIPGARQLSQIVRGRSASLEFLTLHADDGGHPIEALEGMERSVVVQFHRLKCTRSQRDTHFGTVVACVSDHALGRLHDRSSATFSVRDGKAVAFACGVAGLLASTDLRLSESELSLAIGNVVATGSMKVAVCPGSNRATAFFDVRTVLPTDACNDPQMAQATAVARIVLDGGRTSEIAFIPRRQDFVLDTLRR